MTLRDDLQLIYDWIPQNAHVLDLGCGDGELLGALMRHKHCTGYGIEIDPDSVQAAREKAATAFYLVVDEEFPRWLASLAGEEAPDEAKWRWRERLRKTATGQCDRLVESVAPSAYAGRADGNRHIDVGISLAWFEASIRETLPAHPDSQSESKKD